MQPLYFESSSMPKERKLKRHLVNVTKTDEGYTINPPQHRGLVLSGGGAKGIAYLGLITALEERGHLKAITHVSGASAGAMTASLLAVGMKQDNINKLVSNLDITKLLDKSGIGFRAKGDRFRNVLDLIYMVQIKEHLNALEKPIALDQQKNYIQLNQKIALYQQALAKQGVTIDSVDDIINLTKSAENLEKIDQAFSDLPQQIHGPNGEELETPRITLGDLGVLRALLPEDQKYQIKNLTVVVTNQTKNAIERYGEKSTPQQSIAQVVQWSGAHPALFVPGTNAKGESIADGGILDNMPEIEGFDREEVLCVKAEANDAFHKRVDKAKESTPDQISRFKAFLDSGIRIAIGGEWLHAVSSLMNREKVFHHIENMLYINTGEVTTTNMSPTEEQKRTAIKNGYDQTNELLDSQKKTFDHPLLAVLYVGINRLDQTMLDEHSEPELFKAAAQAKMITLIQEHMVTEMDKGDFTNVKYFLNQIDDVFSLDAGMDPIQKEKAYSLCVKQINYLSEGKLQTHLNEVAIKETAAAKKEAAAKEPSFVWKALKALWAPIDWILSKINSSAPEVEIKVSPGALAKHNNSNQIDKTEVNAERCIQIKGKLAELKDSVQEKIHNALETEDATEHQAKSSP